jgi:hypothetical protein
MGMAFDFKIGDKVFWTDPDEDNPCSGKGTIVHIQGEGEFPVDDETIIALKMADGGEVECLPCEIKKVC